MPKDQFTIRLPKPTCAILQEFIAKHEVSLSIALVMIVAQWNELANKPVAKTEMAPKQPVKFDNKARWKGESVNEYNERLAVQSGLGGGDAAVRAGARVLARYKARGMPDIIWDENE